MRHGIVRRFGPPALSLQKTPAHSDMKKLFLPEIVRCSTPQLREEALDGAGITLNKNCVPGDRRSPFQTSGVRIGTAAMTTRGYTAEDFRRVAHRIDAVLRTLSPAENAADKRA